MVFDKMLEEEKGEEEKGEESQEEEFQIEESQIEESQEEVFDSELSMMDSITLVTPDAKVEDLQGRILIAKYCFIRVE
jgi:hypothetical protein